MESEGRVKRSITNVEDNSMTIQLLTFQTKIKKNSLNQHFGTFFTVMIKMIN